MKKNILLSLFFMFAALTMQAQKVKYKDLYFLLDTKQYKEAEPFLRGFLAEGKNIDHPNANYQMALLLENKSVNQDVLTETGQLITFLDSALIYYKYAAKYIDEKEVKRNEEYYQAYKRRDIRTGKFGIKLADIQFDIEKKIENLNDKKDRVIKLKEYYNQMTLLYDTAQAQFKGIKEEYPNTKSLHLRANDELIKSLDYLQKVYAMTVENYDKYKSASGKIGSIKYDQSLHEKDLLDYENDGESATNFRDDNIELWNYKQWAESVKIAINEKIIPMRERIVLHDNELNRLKEKLKTDSVSVLNDVSGLSTQVLANQLREFDENPLPLLLFDYKVAELKYLSGLAEDSNYRDSLDVMYQLETVNEKIRLLNDMDSLLNLLVAKNLSEEGQNYEYFVGKQFSGTLGLEAYLKEREDFITNGKSQQNDESDQLVERSRWLIDENDSIPLFKVDSLSAQNFKYLPLSIEDHVTTGICKYADNMEGYFAIIEPSRIPKVNIRFKLPVEAFNIQNIAGLKSLCTSDQNGQVNFILLYQPKGEGGAYSTVISKIYTVDGLAWTKQVEMSTKPFSLVYASDSGDLKIVQGNNDGTKTALVFDKKGNIKE